MPEDILPLKHDCGSVVVIGRASEIPLVLRVSSSYFLSVLGLFDLLCAT